MPHGSSISDIPGSVNDFFFDGRIDHFFMLHLRAPHNDFLSLAVALSYVYDPHNANILLVL